MFTHFILEILLWFQKEKEQKFQIAFMYFLWQRCHLGLEHICSLTFQTLLYHNANIIQVFSQFLQFQGLLSFCQVVLDLIIFMSNEGKKMVMQADSFLVYHGIYWTEMFYLLFIKKIDIPLWPLFFYRIDLYM